MTKEHRPPALVVLDTSYLLDGPSNLKNLVSGARDGKVKGLIPDTVLAELEWYARHPEKKEKAWLAAQIVRLLKEGFASGEAEFLTVRPRDCPPPRGLDPQSKKDQVLLTAYQVKQREPDRRVLLATVDEETKAKAESLGIEAIR